MGASVCWRGVGGRRRLTGWKLRRRARTDLRLQRRELCVNIRSALRLVELGLDVVVRAREVSQRTRSEELIERAAASLHLGHLVLRALHRGTGVAMDVEMPLTASDMCAEASAAV